MRLPARLLIVLCLTALAGGLRFYRLADWPFAGDETQTMEEQACLFGGFAAPYDSPTYRLPHMIPLSYSLIHWSCAACGENEFGSRVFGAVLGTLIVPLAFLSLEGWRGRATALAVSVLLALWPEQIFQSQQTRFYIIAGFFSFSSLLVGALAVRRRSIAAAAAACCLVLVAIFCHVVAAVLWGIIFAGVLAAAWAERRPISPRLIFVFLAGGLCIAGVLAAYVWPLMRDWNPGAKWGYSTAHSILGSVNMVGWPVFLLAVLGGAQLWRGRRGEDWYWGVCALGWGAVVLALPRLVPYAPAYSFPFALSIVVLAGCGIGRFYECCRGQGAWAAATGAALLCLVNLPSLASHYVDGSRPDMRTAARYVEKNWQPGDRVAGFSMGLFGHYAPHCDPRIPLPADARETLESLAAGKGRLWIVLQSARGGLSEDLRRWLGTRCSHELTVQRKRFDFPEYTVDVFLHR